MLKVALGYANSNVRLKSNILTDILIIVNYRLSNKVKLIQVINLNFEVLINVL